MIFTAKVKGIDNADQWSDFSFYTICAEMTINGIAALVANVFVDSVSVDCTDNLSEWNHFVWDAFQQWQQKM